MKKLFTLLILLIPIFLFVGCVEVTELDDTKKIELIYSGSYSNFHDFEEPIKWVTSYAEYLESDYSFELNETYFDDYTLYTYSFIYSNLGKNIFLYDDYFLIDNNLLIICDCNEGIVSPAFGNYAIVFGIAKIQMKIMIMR